MIRIIAMSACLGLFAFAMVTPSSMSETPIIWGDGVHDDTGAIQQAILGRTIYFPDGRVAIRMLSASEPVASGSYYRGGEEVR